MNRFASSLCLMLAALSARAQAHDFTITDAQATIFPDHVQIDLLVDLDELALGAPPGSDALALSQTLTAMQPAEFEQTVASLRQMLARRTRIKIDGEVVEPHIEFPGPDVTPAHLAEVPTKLGVVARLRAPRSATASEMTFWASRAFMAVHLTARRADGTELSRQVLPTGAESAPIAFDRVVTESRARIAFNYFVLGVEHIVPKGLDHILFVLGLFLLSARLKPLLWQVTAFTLAHTITLAASMYELIALPASIVEPLIALSIAYVAIENLFTARLHTWRPAIVFGFGLLHGMGFAGVLSELGLPRSEFVTGLIAFNVGVEAGQLLVIGAALLVCGWARNREWYRPRIVAPASILIALVAIYWTIERTVGSPLPGLA